MALGVAAIALVLGFFTSAHAGGKIGIYGLRMEPNGNDAKDFSDANWGLGGHIVVPAPQFANTLAGVIGFEWVNFLSSTTEFRDRQTQLRVEQQTSQNYYRFYVGPQIGGHGNGFIRPHAGINIAWVLYGISTDVVIPNDENPDDEIRQKLESEWKSAFGWDITLGLDLNFSNTVVLDGGIKYLKTMGLVQQLGTAGSETIHPQYFQAYFGVGVAFELLKKASK